MMMFEKQSTGKTYAQLIKFGRMLENHHKAQLMSEERPEVILAIVDSIDRQITWTKIDDFFSLFPPLKRYVDDGRWNYKSTLEMREEELGTYFGKDDFKYLLMTHCYENKFLRLIGLAFAWSVGRAHKQITGSELLDTFISMR
jgi:hypothetical protein